MEDITPLSLAGSVLRSTDPAAIGDIDWVVLSLERLPGRLARFWADNGALGLPIESVPATDGVDMDRQELAQLDLLLPDQMHGWTDDAIGNAFSHWLCWHRAVESNRPICILEDRALLRRDFVSRLPGLLAAMPPGWDLLHLGNNTNSIVEFKITPDCTLHGEFAGPFVSATSLEIFAGTVDAVAPLRLHNAFGSFAYVVSPAGAQRLIDACFPLAANVITLSPRQHAQLWAVTVDGLMNRVYQSIEAYLCFPPIALPTSD